MFDYMREDIERVKSEDPAAPSTAIVVLCYSGLHALWNHRLEHRLWERGHRNLARWLAGFTRHFTGVEIHPAAQIGRRVFIDHGMGIVIGETTIIGDDCTLYQGCTLGGTGKETGKRHPTLKDNVIVGVGAAVLGNITIGNNSKVGGGAVVVEDVPEDCTVVGIPGHVVRRRGKRVEEVNMHREDLPDPVISLIGQLKRRIDLIDRRLEILQCVPSTMVARVASAGDDFKLENKSLAAQMLSTENLIREAAERKALNDEIARRTKEAAAASEVELQDDTGVPASVGDVAKIIATALEAKMAELPRDASASLAARAMADVLRGMSDRIDDAAEAAEVAAEAVVSGTEA